MRALWVLLLLSSPLVADAEDDLDVPGLDAVELRGDAMMWEDATIYLEPFESAANVRFGNRREQVGAAIPVRIIDSSLKNFVEIAAPGRGDCTWRRFEVDGRLEGLRMFVRREDLAPVLTRPYAMQWSNGTRIKLAVGMPVVPTTAGDYLVSIKQSDKLRFPIPHASVGYIYIYKASKIVDPELPKEKVALVTRNANLKLGDDSFQVKSTWYGVMSDKKTDVALVKLAARCVELVVQAPINTLRLMAMPRPYVSPPPPPPAPIVGWRIPVGTPLMTLTGREVAVAAKDIAVQMPAPAPEQICFDATFSMVREDETSIRFTRPVRLCASGSAVTR